MAIKLLTARQYMKQEQITRRQLDWRAIKNPHLVLKVSPKKLWFLPSPFKIAS